MSFKFLGFCGRRKRRPHVPGVGATCHLSTQLGFCLFCKVISVWKLIYSNCKWQRKLVSRQDLKWKRKDLVQSFLQGRSCWVKASCWERKEFPMCPVFSPQLTALLQVWCLPSCQSFEGNLWLQNLSGLLRGMAYMCQADDGIRDIETVTEQRKKKLGTCLPKVATKSCLMSVFRFRGHDAWGACLGRVCMCVCRREG